MLRERRFLGWASPRQRPGRPALKILAGNWRSEARAIYITDAEIVVIGATSSGSPMSALSLVLNLLWIIFGGLWMAFGWVIAGIVMAITIIGLPWARAAFNIASYTLLPFGYKAVSRARLLRARGYRHRAARPDRQYHLAGAGRMVAGARPCRHRRSSCRHHHRHPLRLGAPEARRHRALADRQDHRAGGRHGAAIRTPVVNRGHRPSTWRSNRPSSRPARNLLPSDRSPMSRR